MDAGPKPWEWASLLHIVYPHNILHNHCFEFLLGITVVLREVENNGHAVKMKLRLGVDGKALEWFASYLADRTQRVTVNDGLSSAFPLRQGVPQGSCLGPLLFTVYTSKLFDIVSKHLPSVHCYADDTQLYLAFSPHVL